MKPGTTLIGMAIATLFLTPGLVLADIAVRDAFVRSSRPGAPTAAAFMVLENTADTADRLIAVSSDAAARVELHTHRSDANGVMSMMPIEGGIELPAHGSHALERGGDHVMLMGLSAPLADGDTIQMTLSFEQAGEIEIDVPVDSSR